MEQNNFRRKEKAKLHLLWIKHHCVLGSATNKHKFFFLNFLSSFLLSPFPDLHFFLMLALQPTFIESTNILSINNNTQSMMTFTCDDASSPQLFKSEDDIRSEFTSIREWTREFRLLQSTDVALRNENSLKNRYHDVLPFDDTRVRLQNNSMRNDYINASHIRFGSSLGPSNYISCQAPLPSTFNDFWMMVWEQKVKTIVMLTNCVENGKVKAQVYWPEERQQLQFGNIVVYGIQTKIIAGITLRCFRMYLFSNSGEIKEERTLFHIHYTEWTDMGVPVTSNGINNLIKLVDLCSRRKFSPTEPIVVHCSAGIGRAGTFIAIDEAVRRLRNPSNQSNPEKYIDIQNIVRVLRSQRIGMVQTPEQYCYIYNTVQEIFNNTPVS